MKVLAIIGAGGHGKVVASTAKLMGWKKIFFYDDNKKVCLNNKLYKGNIKSLCNDREKINEIFVAIGDNLKRVKIYNFLKKELKKNFSIIIHPSSIIAKNVKIQENCYISANSVINSNSFLDHSTIVNTSVTLEHDFVCKSGVHLSPGVITGGNVTIYENSWVGLGSNIINNITIGSNVIIGAGSVVIKNVKNNSKIIGVPAREK